MALLAAIAAAVMLLGDAPLAQSPSARQHPGLRAVQTETPERRVEWEQRLAAMVRSGRLKLREERQAAGSSARDQWYVQLHKGVPVVGGEVWRRLEGDALVRAEGSLYDDITISPVPKLTRVEVRQALLALAPGTAGPSRPPELVVLPTPDGKYLLAYRARVFDGSQLLVQYVDASTAVLVLIERMEGPLK